MDFLNKAYAQILDLFEERPDPPLLTSSCPDSEGDGRRFQISAFAQPDMAAFARKCAHIVFAAV